MDDSTQLNVPWKIGLVLETPELSSGIKSALSEAGAVPVIEFSAAMSSLEVANAVERERPDILFAELSHTAKPAAEWMADVRRGEDTPLVVAVHATADPAEMISALRSGASEFICLPVRPAIFEAFRAHRRAARVARVGHARARQDRGYSLGERRLRRDQRGVVIWPLPCGPRPALRAAFWWRIWIISRLAPIRFCALSPVPMPERRSRLCGVSVRPRGANSSRPPVR